MANAVSSDSVQQCLHNSDVHRVQSGQLSSYAIPLCPSSDMQSQRDSIWQTAMRDLQDPSSGWINHQWLIAVRFTRVPEEDIRTPSDGLATVL